MGPFLVPHLCFCPFGFYLAVVSLLLHIYCIHLILPSSLYFLPYINSNPPTYICFSLILLALWNVVLFSCFFEFQLNLIIFCERTNLLKETKMVSFDHTPLSPPPPGKIIHQEELEGFSKKRKLFKYESEYEEFSEKSIHHHHHQMMMNCITSSTDLHLETPLPSEWQRCLDIKVN